MSWTLLSNLEWVDTASSRGSSWPRIWTCVSCIGRQVLYHRATGEAQKGQYVKLRVDFLLVPNPESFSGETWNWTQKQRPRRDRKKRQPLPSSRWFVEEAGNLQRRLFSSTTRQIFVSWFQTSYRSFKWGSVSSSVQLINTLITSYL